MLISTATVPGSSHTRPGQPGKINNQDVVVVREANDTTVVVLADGCGSQSRSETGADIGANIAATIVLNQMQQSKNVDWPNLANTICKNLAPIIKLFSDNFDEALMQRFMFTLSIVVIHKDIVTVAMLGDGMMVVDDLVVPFEAPIDNTPAYIGYLMREDSPYHGSLREHLNFKVVYRRPITDIKKSLVISTDGLRDLCLDDIHHPGLLGKQNALQFWLASQNLERIEDGKIVPGRCRDDVTLVLIRSEETQARLIESRSVIVQLKTVYNELFENLCETYSRWKVSHPYNMESETLMTEYYRRADTLYETAERVNAVLDCQEIARKVHEKIADLRTIPRHTGHSGYSGYGGCYGGGGSWITSFSLDNSAPAYRTPLGGLAPLPPIAVHPNGQAEVTHVRSVGKKNAGGNGGKKNKKFNKKFKSNR